MKKWKNYASILLALVLCLSVTACGDSNENKENKDVETKPAGKEVDPDVGGSDWRTTGVWTTDGTMTIDGEVIDVLVCVHNADANFYYNEKEQMLYNYVDYPITLDGDADEMFNYISFEDLNYDGNSDVTMSFDNGGKEILMVWFWDPDTTLYVYQPDESNIDGLGDVVPDNNNNNNNGNGNGFYSWDSDLCQRNVSEFEGVWYYEGDLSATTYIIIDGYGNWSYFERSAGDPEGTEMDYGTFSYSADEISTYYADSSKYENLSMRVFEFDEGTLIWDDDTYYRME